MSPRLTLEQYTIALSRMYAWWAPTERTVTTLLNDAPFSVRLQLRSTLLRQDLEQLDSPIDAEASGDALPALTTEAHAVGALYVLEGSALGGQIISRQLRRQLDLDERTGTRFFSGNGHRTGERWRAVCAAVECYPRAMKADVLVGAETTFASLFKWLK